MSQALVIKNSFSEAEIRLLAQEIYALILTENELTPRSIGWITQRLQKQECYIAFIENKLVGFIFIEQINKIHIEIKTWFVIKQYRKTPLAIGDELFKKSFSRPGFIYFGNTYRKELLEYFTGYGFKVMKASDLGLYFLISYITSRSLTTLFRFFRRKKEAYFLAKLT